MHKEVVRMKRTARILLCCFLLSLFVLAGCRQEEAPLPDAGTEEPAGPADSTELKISDYFPILQNARYVYQGEGNEYASYSVYNDYTAENKVQQRVDNGGTVMAKVIAITEGHLLQTFSSGESYYREDHLDAAGAEEILLMEPLAAGTAWTLADGRTRTIANLSVAVSTPAGDYDALEVTTAGNGDTATHYYAKDVGLVKAVYVSGESEISSTLSAIENDVPLTQRIRFFYPNVDEDRIYYADREVDFRTNDVTKDVIAGAYQEVPPGVEKVFSVNTAVNSLYRGSDGLVYLDLNQAFLTEMNAGSAYEAMILDCIADTFGSYYQTDKVVLTIEGGPYLSGHFAFGEGEYLEADVTDAAPL